jgi:hypothetical protein
MEGKLRNLQYNQTAKFTVGREVNGKQLVFSTYDVDTFCEYKNTYTVTFDYGTISADENSFTGTGGLIGLQFYFESTNEHFNQSQAVSKQAGDLIYLTLQLNDTANKNFNHAENFTATTGKAFVPSKCLVVDSASKRNFTIFDTAATDCSNDVIDLVVNYDSDAHVWQIQHTIFLLDNQDESTYHLSCDVVVCDMQKGDDCKTAYSCLVPSQETETEEEEEVCVPDPLHENKYTGDNCEGVYNSIVFYNTDICTGSLAGPYVLGKDGRLWRDACCWKQWDLTKDCDF